MLQIASGFPSIEKNSRLVLIKYFAFALQMKEKFVNYAISWDSSI